MTQYDFLKQCGGLKGQGDGFRKEIDFDLRNAYLLSDGSGLTTTLTTNPGFAASETNAMVLQWNAAIVVGAAFYFPVPRDYDQSADEFRIRAYFQMGGATDTPTVSAHAYRKRVGAALTADLGPVTGKTPSAGLSPLTSGQAANLALSNALAAVEFDLSKNSFQGGDILYVQLVPGTHATDAVKLSELMVQYRTTLALYTESQR